ncbi:helix-turn-helix transcriptional regulator [Thalassovita sp.]|uniref:helix-turn-helix transcriptional regulator n=1 Tax=Thalassovita sp. TaxID=1979401 RepID=UPI002AAF60DB|nr:helix-turn-helix transcriptional regulator [Thalassovita sp.]
MALIHQKVQAILAEKNLNLRRAAISCGINYRTLHSAISNERDLTFSLLDPLTRGLGVSLSYFSSDVPIDKIKEHIHQTGPALIAIKTIEDALTAARENAKGRPNCSDFLDWWYRNDGRLDEFDGIRPYVDQFLPPEPDAALINPTEIGEKSLATKHFDLHETRHLTQTLEGFSYSANLSLRSAHMEALERGQPVVSHPQLHERLRNGEIFRSQYRRILAPVTLSDGTTGLLNFSEDLG